MGLTPTNPSAAAGETLLEFPDNRLLMDLCGPHDRHLARIEQALGVHVLRRGNQLSVVGPAEAQAEAAQILRGLYARLEQGRAVELSEVESALRMGTEGDGPAATPAQQLEMFGQGKIELRTRKKIVEPRTEAQRGTIVPVEISIFEDRTFSFVTKTPPAPVLIREKLGIDKGSQTPGRGTIAKISDAQLAEIAEIKLPDLNTDDIEAAKAQIAGTARSMGIAVEG